MDSDEERTDSVGPTWDYPTPPGRDAVSLARGDFFPRLVRPPLQLAFRAYLRLAHGHRVEGRANIPRRGPFVLVANHTSHADTAALVASLPLRRVNDTHPLAAQDYFFEGRVLGAVVHTLVNALPLDRHAGAEAATAGARALLADGRGIILFPEGTRSTTGAMGRFKRGVGVLLAGTDVPAVPAWIEGAREVWPKGERLPHPGPLAVRIGTPLGFEDTPHDEVGHRAVADALEDAVRALATGGQRAPARSPGGPGPSRRG